MGQICFTDQIWVQKNNVIIVFLSWRNYCPAIPENNKFQNTRKELIAERIQTFEISKTHNVQTCRIETSSPLYVIRSLISWKPTDIWKPSGRNTPGSTGQKNLVPPSIGMARYLSCSIWNSIPSSSIAVGSTSGSRLPMDEEAYSLTISEGFHDAARR